MSTAEELMELRRENERLKAALKGPDLSLRVSPKGAVSVYGLGRFPTTLYAEQWERLLERADDIKSFIASNANRLTRKGA